MKIVVVDNNRDDSYTIIARDGRQIGDSELLLRLEESGLLLECGNTRIRMEAGAAMSLSLH